MNIDDMLLLLMFNATCTINLVEIPSEDRLKFYEVCDKFVGKRSSEIEPDQVYPLL